MVEPKLVNKFVGRLRVYENGTLANGVASLDDGYIYLILLFGLIKFVSDL